MVAAHQRRAAGGARRGLAHGPRQRARVTPACRVSNGTVSYGLTPAQAQNATTIATVGKAMGLADHAVTIALATSLQEARLLNLPYGDRDSLGLFQQRPSQGWGRGPM